MVRLGIIGTGVIVQEFLPKLTSLDGIEIVALMDIPCRQSEVERLCASYGIAYAVTDFQSFLETGVNAAYIAVPNALHYQYCKDALVAGLNVIVEKPVTGNLMEAEELWEIARTKRLFLFEAVTTRYFNAYEKVKEWLSRIGSIKVVQCTYCQYSRRYDDFRSGNTPAVFDPIKSGGALMDLNLYNLHFVTGLLGEPKRVSYFANMERGIDTSGMMILEYDEFTVNCTLSKDWLYRLSCFLQ